MKRYLIIFFTALALSILAIGIVGTHLLTRTLNLQKTETLIPELEEIQKKVQQIYGITNENPAAGSEIEELASRIDSFRGQVAYLSIQKEYYTGIAIYIALLLGITLLGGIFLWLGMMKIFIRPLEATVKELQKIAAGDFLITITPSGAREIRYLQRQVIELAGEVDKSQTRIKTMERQHIGRFLVHQVRNSITPIRLCTGVLKKEMGKSADKETAASAESIPDSLL